MCVKDGGKDPECQAMDWWLDLLNNVSKFLSSYTFIGFQKLSMCSNTSLVFYIPSLLIYDEFYKEYTKSKNSWVEIRQTSNPKFYHFLFHSQGLYCKHCYGHIQPRSCPLRLPIFPSLKAGVISDLPVNSRSAEIRCQDLDAGFFAFPVGSRVLPLNKQPKQGCLAVPCSPRDCLQAAESSEVGTCLTSCCHRNETVSGVFLHRQPWKQQQSSLASPRPVLKGMASLMGGQWESGPISCSHIMLARPGLALIILTSSHSRWICLLRVQSWPRGNLKQSTAQGACIRYILQEGEEPPNGQYGMSA